MWELIVSVGLSLLKLLLEMREKRKLSEEEFLKYIDAYRKQKGRAADAAQEFEDEFKKD